MQSLWGSSGAALEDLQQGWLLWDTVGRALGGRLEPGLGQKPGKIRGKGRGGLEDEGEKLLGLRKSYRNKMEKQEGLQLEIREQVPGEDKVVRGEGAEVGSTG